MCCTAFLLKHCLLSGQHGTIKCFFYHSSKATSFDPCSRFLPLDFTQATAFLGFVACSPHDNKDDSESFTALVSGVTLFPEAFFFFLLMFLTTSSWDYTEQRTHIDNSACPYLHNLSLRDTRQCASGTVPGDPPTHVC